MSSGTRLRELGYLQDVDERWIHPQLRLEAQDPQALLQVEHEQLRAFHDPDTWADCQPQPIPQLPDALLRHLREVGMRWDGWVGGWEEGSGLFLRSEELEQLGAQGLEQLRQGQAEWSRKHSLRLRGGCAGMTLMLVWLAVGWVFGHEAWIGGMVVIAVGTFVLRPRGMPASLWGALDQELLPRRLSAGARMLGPEWQDVARNLSALPVDDEHVYLMVLERCVSLEQLRSSFTPDGLGRILRCLAPVEL